MWKIDDRVGFIGGGNIAFAMGSVLIAKGSDLVYDAETIGNN